MHSEGINRFFRRRKTLKFHFCLRTGIKRSHSMPSQGYTADDSSNRCFECSRMQLFERMCESSNCRSEEWSVFIGWFSRFLRIQLANQWLCTTHNWLRPVFPKKQTITCLEKLRARATFVGFSSSWNTHTPPHRLLFTFGLIRVNTRFITFHDVIDVFRSTAIVFLEHFFRPIDTSLFLSDWQNVWDRMFMQYGMYAGPTNA